MSSLGETLPWEGGRVELLDVPSTGARIDVLVPGIARIARRVNATPGECVDLGDVPLEPAIDFVGRAVFADGSPAAGWCVLLREQVDAREDRDLWNPSAITADDGRFVLRGLGRGRVTLLAGPPAGPPHVRVPPPEVFARLFAAVTKARHTVRVERDAAPVTIVVVRPPPRAEPGS